jgi:type II secretory pathway component GspD/PulD (secretin)
MKDRPRSRFTVLRGNRTVLVYGDPQTMLKVQDLLARLDAVAAAKPARATGAPKRVGEPVVRVIQLRSVDLDAALDAELRMLLDTHHLSGQFVLDKNRQAVVVAGEADTVVKVAGFLAQLEETSGHATQAAPAAALRVRLFWVVNSGPREEGAKFPDALKGVAGELARLGIDRPRLAAQLSLSTTAQSRFEASGRASLEAAHRLSLAGTVSDGREESALEVAVTRAAGGRDGGPVCRFRTRLRIPLDRPVVLGSAPADALKSAFVVLVQPPTAPAAGGGIRGPGAGVAQRAHAPTATAKTFRFKVRDKPWKQVLEWLSDHTGSAVVSAYRPTGTFTFIDPKARPYTVPEIIDILNEGLASQHYLIVRHARHFMLIPTDKALNSTMVRLPVVSLDELDQHGRTELVTVVIRLKGLSAEDVAPEIKKMLGPLGEVTALPHANQLVIMDTVGNLRRIPQVLKDMDAQAREDGGKAPKQAPLKRPRE